jgi:hypothetical protein
MRSVWVLGAVGLMFAAAVWPAHAGGGNPIAAVWKEQHLDFLYLGRTSRYSCDGLRDKVRAMLLDLGARRDLRIAALGCEGAAARMQLVFSTPALPDPKQKPLHPGDLAAVNARFEAFTITSDAFRNMGIADCELVEAFAQQILPKLAARGVKREAACVVRGEILRTLPPGQAPRGTEFP